MSYKAFEMVVMCAGLGDSQVEPNCEFRLVLVPGLGPLTRDRWAEDSLKSAFACLRGFRNLWKMSQDQPFMWKSVC